MTAQSKDSVEDLVLLRDHYTRFIRQLLPNPADMARAFDAYALLPENGDFILELVNGEIIVKMPSNARASEIAAEIIYQLKRYLDDHDLEGHVTGEAGGYQIGYERYAPDVAYMAADKQPKLAGKGYNPVPPDLAVEVETNQTKETKAVLQSKIEHYLSVGTVVWVIYPEQETVEIHAPDKETIILSIKDTLEGGEVLPGFSVAVKKIFR